MENFTNGTIDTLELNEHLNPLSTDVVDIAMNIMFDYVVRQPMVDNEANRHFIEVANKYIASQKTILDLYKLFNEFVPLVDEFKRIKAEWESNPPDKEFYKIELLANICDDEEIPLEEIGKMELAVCSKIISERSNKSPLAKDFRIRANKRVKAILISYVFIVNAILMYREPEGRKKIDELSLQSLETISSLLKLDRPDYKEAVDKYPFLGRVRFTVGATEFKDSDIYLYLCCRPNLIDFDNLSQSEIDYIRYLKSEFGAFYKDELDDL